MPMARLYWITRPHDYLIPTAGSSPSGHNLRLQNRMFFEQDEVVVFGAGIAPTI
jgi:hypothetical protein